MLSNDDLLYRIGVAGLFGSKEGKLKVLPKLQGDVLFNFQRNVDLYHSWYVLAGAELTSEYIAPKAGFSMFGILDVTGGYGFSWGKSPSLSSGINIGVTLNVPIVFIKDVLWK